MVTLRAGHLPWDGYRTTAPLHVRLWPQVPLVAVPQAHAIRCLAILISTYNRLLLRYQDRPTPSLIGWSSSIKDQAVDLAFLWNSLSFRRQYPSDILFFLEMRFLRTNWCFPLCRFRWQIQSRRCCEFHVRSSGRSSEEIFCSRKYCHIKARPRKIKIDGPTVSFSRRRTISCWLATAKVPSTGTRPKSSGFGRRQCFNISQRDGIQSTVCPTG